MSKTHKHYKHILIFGMLLVISLGAVAYTTLGDYYLSLAEQQTIARLSQTGWSIIIADGEQTDNIVIGIEYYKNSKEGIDAYLRANQEAAQRLFASKQAVPAVITFASPMALSDFEKLVNDNTAKITRYIIRGVDSQGLPTTIGGEPDTTNLIPSERLNALLEMSEKAGNPISLQGVVIAYGIVDAPTYERLRSSSTVYAIEILESLAREQADLELQRLNLRPLKIEYIEPEALYVHLETLGVLPDTSK
jgi:hypothetical protein